MRQQRVRGVSFKEEYACAMRRRPRLEARALETVTERTLLAPKASTLTDRITVVLDLDETLVYAREGPLYVRPGIEELLQFLEENCETVVWTAGMKQYAEAVVRLIDTNGCVHHTIARDSTWFRGSSCSKDLSLLGRDTETTIVFENTPDCIRGFEQNGVLVADYEGGELEDYTLYTILGLLKDLVRRRNEEHITVPEYIRSSNLLNLRVVPTDGGDEMSCYCLNAYWPELETTRSMHSKRRKVLCCVGDRRNIAVH
ncbi:nuclear lim interactor-interacting factor [Trypanosoma conorhini]|uniref:Mitochondrial import inner membrane translocase subunit TIM50 n=1 Tax=Trypanosoma conorhini TaxID=83891 RepID=A0A422Q743_9TRYP|nr:nuclear lim interactor-interacting factor [Trypanosoma conorhini]RNF25780.1 nuclear lim interactor-interacting factor [Trypanosoma conorhini]